jgi:hypothetical protein
MSESIAVEAAFGSCEKWFPLIGRIEIAMRPMVGSFTWKPTQAQWLETSSLISRLIAEFGEHSQTIRDELVWHLEFALIPATRIQFAQQAHFSGKYGKHWESAALAVVDETERFLNELLGSFDPLCDLNSVSGTSRAIKAIPEPVPTAAQLSTIQQVVNQFCIQCDIPRVCSELREQIEVERKHLLIPFAAPIDLDDVGDLPSVKTSTTVTPRIVDDVESEAACQHENAKERFAESTSEVPLKYRNRANSREHWGPLVGSGAILARAISGNPNARRPYLDKHHERKIFVRKMADRELEVYFQTDQAYLNAKRALDNAKSTTAPEQHRHTTAATDTQ